jgi:hypothetical protein
MALRCPNCRQTHPDLARFCGRCGRSLPQVPSGPTLKPIQRHRPATGTSCSGWVFFFLCTLAFGGVWLTAGQRCQQRRFDLTEWQSAALFELLKPEDVRVGVSPPDSRGGVCIEGTKSEVRAVEQFVRLLEGRHARRRCRSTADEARTYNLLADRAEALARALRLSNADVHVVPLPESRGLGRLAITAAPEDHRAIEGMVRILNGYCVSFSSRCEGE